MPRGRPEQDEARAGVIGEAIAAMLRARLGDRWGDRLDALLADRLRNSSEASRLARSVRRWAQQPGSLPSVVALIDLAQALGCSIDELVGRRSPHSGASNEPWVASFLGSFTHIPLCAVRLAKERAAAWQSVPERQHADDELLRMAEAESLHALVWAQSPSFTTLTGFRRSGVRLYDVLAQRVRWILKCRPHGARLAATARSEYLLGFAHALANEDQHYRPYPVVIGGGREQSLYTGLSALPDGCGDERSVHFLAYSFLGESLSAGFRQALVGGASDEARS